jgi:hypothetical protein
MFSLFSLILIILSFFSSILRVFLFFLLLVIEFIKFVPSPLVKQCNLIKNCKLLLVPVLLKYLNNVNSLIKIKYFYMYFIFL